MLCNGQGLCTNGHFQTGWRLFKTHSEAQHPLGYSTYQTVITSAFKVWASSSSYSWVEHISGLLPILWMLLPSIKQVLLVRQSLVLHVLLIAVRYTK